MITRPSPHRHPSPNTAQVEQTAQAEETALWEQVRQLGSTADSPADPCPQNPGSVFDASRHDHDPVNRRDRADPEE